LLALLVVVGAVGIARISPLDDIRQMQDLPQDLRDEQARIRHLTGATVVNKYFLITAPDDETALARGEQLGERLSRLRAERALAGYRMPASFVPSIQRQMENARLVETRLELPFLDRQLETLRLSKTDRTVPGISEPLTLDRAVEAVPFLRDIVLAGVGTGVTHVVMLEGPISVEKLRDAGDGIDGVHFVDPVHDVSLLLGVYRRWAIALIALSAVVMAVSLAWRYRMLGALRVMVPPVAGLALAPAIVALFGGTFSFFDAIALVLVLAIGVDYSIFCAEASVTRRPVTLLAVSLASLTSVITFGLLSFSGVFAVRSFGTTMLLGIALVYVLAPLASGERNSAPREP
jgi:predicted exporter